jgi:hypothetical protein
MPKKQNCSELTAANLLHSLRCRGGSAPLHSIHSSRTVVQYLLDRELVRVKNTGCGFLLSVVERQ